MDLRNLEETDVLSLTLDQAHRYFEMVFCTDDGRNYKLCAWNEDGARLGVTLGALHIRGNLANAGNRGVLGELESISWVDDVLTLEGDFGDITIKAARVAVEALA